MSVETKESTATPSPPLEATSITPSEGYVPAEAESLFSDEVVTEAELMGEDPAPSEGDPPADPPATDEPQAETKTPAEVETEPETKDEPETKTEPEQNETEPEPDSGKPPAGFVPLKALQEERTKRKELATQLVELQEAVDLLGKEEKTETKENEFAILSDDDLETLIEDDPQEALRYQVRLQKHQAKQRAVNLAKQSEDLNISEAVVEIQQVLPDIYDENSTSATELADFAVSKGFDPDYLPLLTDPRTKLITPDGKTKMVLGVGAASVISILHNMKNQQSVSETDVRTKLEKEITEQVTKQILAKMKGDAVPMSINDLPGASEEISGDTILTEAQMARMSKADIDAYMHSG